MKTGRSLQAIAAELERQRASKRDFLVDTRKIEIIPPAAPLTAEQKKANVVPVYRATLNGREDFTIRNHAIRQIEDHFGVPAKFADHLAVNHPDMLAWNLNQLLNRSPSTQLVRCLDEGMRAFLTNSYRIIDNFDFADAVFEVLSEFPTVQIESSEVTESRLYIKVIRPDLTARVGFREGWEMGKDHNWFDEVVAACTFSNSEIGAGRLWFKPGTWTHRCTNLATYETGQVSKIHLGGKNSAGEEGYWEVLSDDTKKLSDAALWSQIKDLTRAALQGKFFNEQVAMLQGATQQKIEGDVPACVELAAKTFQLTDPEKKGVLRHLIEGGNLTRYGLHAAITRYSQDVESYDRATELERLGGRIIELPKTEWKKLAEAA